MRNEEKILDQEHINGRAHQDFDASKLINAMCRVIAASRSYSDIYVSCSEVYLKNARELEEALKEFDKLNI